MLRLITYLCSELMRREHIALKVHR